MSWCRSAVKLSYRSKKDVLSRHKDLTPHLVTPTSFKQEAADRSSCTFSSNVSLNLDCGTVHFSQHRPPDKFSLNPKTECYAKFSATEDSLFAFTVRDFPLFVAKVIPFSSFFKSFVLAATTGEKPKDFTSR